MSSSQVSAASAERDLHGAYDAGGQFWANPEDMPADAERFDADGNPIDVLDPTTLKPCAWCGAAARVYATASRSYVECINTECATMPSTSGYVTEAAARAAWNTRAPSHG